MGNSGRFPLRSRAVAGALIALGYVIGSSHVNHAAQSITCPNTASCPEVRPCPAMRYCADARPTYDIIDIGANHGGSTKFMQEALEKNVASSEKIAAIRTRTLGIDKNPRKVAASLSNKVDCIQADIFELSEDVLNRVCGRPVVGATMWHVLEHMPNCELASDIWHRVSNLVNGFSSFRGPCFDDKEIPLRYGLHRFYEDWFGHTCHFDSSMLVEAISSAEKKAFASVVILSKPIFNSDSDVLLPEGSAPDSHQYDPIKHPRKNFVEFDSPVWEEMRACAVYEHGNLTIQSVLCLKDALKPFYNGKTDDCRVVHCSSPTPSSAEDCIRSLIDLVDRTIEHTNNLSAQDLREAHMLLHEHPNRNAARSADHFFQSSATRQSL